MIAPAEPLPIEIVNRDAEISWTCACLVADLLLSEVDREAAAEAGEGSEK